MVAVNSKHFKSRSIQKDGRGWYIHVKRGKVYISLDGTGKGVPVFADSTNTLGTVEYKGRTYTLAYTMYDGLRYYLRQGAYPTNILLNVGAALL